VLFLGLIKKDKNTYKDKLIHDIKIKLVRIGNNLVLCVLAWVETKTTHTPTKKRVLEFFTRKIYLLDRWLRWF